MQAVKKIASVFLRVAVSVALLVILFKANKLDLPALSENMRRADMRFLIIAFGVLSLNYLLCFLRWEMLLKAIGITLPLRRVIISFAGGTFFNLFLPSTIGGDFVRTVDLAAHTRKPRQVFATVLLDRLSGYVGLVLITLFALWLGRDLVHDRSIFIIVGIIVGILLLVLFMLFSKPLFSRFHRLLNYPRAGRIGEAVRNLHEEIHLFRYHKKMLARNLFISLLIQSVCPLSFYFTARAMGVDASMVYFFIFVPIVSAITLLPISIGGLGIRENMTVFFFSKIGIDQNTAVVMSLFSFFFIVLFGAIGGLIYVLTVHHRRPQCDTSPSLRTSPR